MSQKFTPGPWEVVGGPDPENLRLATASQNIANQATNTKNTSGHKGVTWSKEKRKWAAESIFGEYACTGGQK